MDTHAPLKKLKNINLSLRQNPGLLLPFRNPFLLKKLTRKFGTAKDPQIKEKYREYKDYRNTSKVKLTATIIILKPTGRVSETYEKP